MRGRLTVCAAQVLLGYREVPQQEEAIVSVLNPPGIEARCTPRVWNAGDCRMKLITYRRKEVAKAYAAAEEDTANNATEGNALERV
jgi:hypothetical protein